MAIMMATMSLLLLLQLFLVKSSADISQSIINNNNNNELIINPHFFVPPVKKFKRIEETNKPSKFLRYKCCYGQFNNQRQSLINALCLARRLNRTVVFDGWEEFPRKATTVSMPFGVYMDKERAVQANLNFIDRYEYDAMVAPLLKLGDSVAGRELKLAASNTEELKEIVEEYSLIDSIELFVGRLYFYGVNYQFGVWKRPHMCTANEYQIIHLALLPNFNIRRSVYEWAMSKNLNVPFAGVHHRHAEGLCKQTADEELSIITHSGKMDGINIIFLATDGQVPEKDKRLAEHFNVIQYDGELRKLRSTYGYITGIVDAYILAQSDVLFTNWYSTLSLTAKQMHKVLKNYNIHDGGGDDKFDNNNNNDNNIGNDDEDDNSVVPLSSASRNKFYC